MVKLPPEENLMLPRSRSHHRWGSRMSLDRFEALKRDPVPRTPADLIDQVARCLMLMRKFTDTPDVHVVITLMKAQYEDDQDFQTLCRLIFGKTEPAPNVENPER